MQPIGARASPVYGMTSSFPHRGAFYEQAFHRVTAADLLQSIHRRTRLPLTICRAWVREFLGNCNDLPSRGPARRRSRSIQGLTVTHSSDPSRIAVGMHTTAGRLENTARHSEPPSTGAPHRVRPAAGDDGTPMVFHDDKLDRLVAATGRIAAYSPTMLSRFRYKGSRPEDIDLRAVLDLVGGRVPLLVEVKGKKSGRMPLSSRRSHGRSAPTTGLSP